MKLKIEYVNINDLIPYANNAKIHTEEQIEQIKKSIQDNGMCDPIGIWKNNEIIEGHGRYIACQELGIEEVPIIRLDYMTDDQRKAYALIHNKLTMNTDFDAGILQLELDDIDIDMSEYGFNSDYEFEDDNDTKEANYNENISVVIDCINDEEAEETFNKLTEEGYKCRISTL